MEVNIHEELRTFWRRDRERKENDELAMCDTLQDDILSPASHRQTDLFDWGSPTSGVVRDIVADTQTPQMSFVSGPGTTRRRIDRDREVPDEAYEYANAERTSPSQPITAVAHGVPEGSINPFHIGWEKNKIWTPITGWISVGRPHSSGPSSQPPPDDLHDHRHDRPLTDEEGC